MFGFKKKQKNAAVCSCGGNCKPALESVKVLGSGCKSCRALLENTQAALKNMGLDVKAEYVTDMQTIAATRC